MSPFLEVLLRAAFDGDQLTGASRLAGRTKKDEKAARA